MASLILTLSACDKPDQAALAEADAASKGQMADGQLQAVASRPVMIGQGGPRAAACRGSAGPAAGGLAVRWSPSSTSPMKADVRGPVAPCEVDGEWTGVVFPAFGQELDECYVSDRVDSPREYQGPCRWGWVETKDLGAAAG